MARAPFQVAAFPFRKLKSNAGIEYAVFRRSVEGYWQSIAGGGEDEETPQQAIEREAFEEAGIPRACQYHLLQTRASVPVIHFKQRVYWPPSLLVIPVFYFGIDVSNFQIRLSVEHSEHQWVTLEQGHELLKWDSDKTALWELEQLLTRSDTHP